MTTPPPHPGDPGWRGRGNPPPDPATRRIQLPGRGEAPTQRIRSQGGQPPPYQPREEPRTELLRQAAPPPGYPSPGGQQPGEKKTGFWKTYRRWWIIGNVVVLLLLVLGVPIGAEFYARSQANSRLVTVAECIVKDDVTVSVGTSPPFLWQYFNDDYSRISVSTAGNQVSEAKGMQADVTIEDIKLADSGDSKGTIGSLTATLTWTAAGIKDTVVENVPVVGDSVTDVTTDASAGTITIALGDTDITAKPVVVDGDLNLELVDANVFVQTALDGLTATLNDNYPLGIKADSVEVTDTGVVGAFSSQNASIPNSDSDGCFDSL